MTRQYEYLGFDKNEYQSKLMDALERFNKKSFTRKFHISLLYGKCFAFLHHYLAEVPTLMPKT